MKRSTKITIAILLFFIVQVFVTGFCCKLSAKPHNLRTDLEILLHCSHEEINTNVKKLEELNVYCSRSRIIELTHDLSPEYWVTYVEKHGYKQVEVKPEFTYCYRLDDSLFAYRWEYKDTITDYATLYIGGKYYYFERTIK